MSRLDEPQAWTTGDDAPTEKQKSFLATLASDKGVTLNPKDLNKGEASQKIDALKNMGSSTQGNDSKPSEAIQDPNTWTTGDDQATSKQMGYIAVMAKEAGEDAPSSMGKSDASKKIEALKEKTGM